MTAEDARVHPQEGPTVAADNSATSAGTGVATAQQVQDLEIVDECKNAVDDDPSPFSPSSVGSKVKGFVPSMSTLSATLFITSSILDAAVFATPSVVLNSVGSFGAASMLWLVGGVTAIASALTYVEWGLIFPGRNGSDQLYLYHAYPKPKALLAFLFSWCVIYLIRPGYTSAIATVSAKYFLYGVWGTPDAAPAHIRGNWTWISKTFAVLIITTITLYNALSTNFAVRAQNVLSSAKLVTLAVLIIAGILAMSGAIKADLAESPVSDGRFFANSSPNAADYVSGLLVVFYTFDGFASLNYCAADLKTPVKSLPIGAVAGTGISVALVWLANITFMAVVPYSEFLQAKEVLGGVFAARIFGEVFGKRVVPFLLSMASYGCCSAWVFAISRVTLASARKNMIPFSSFFARIHPRFGTPLNALLLNFIISFVFIVGTPGEDQFQFLIQVATYPLWIFYGLTAAGTFIFRYTAPKVARPFRVWLVVPGLVALVAVFLTIVPFTSTDIRSWLPATIAVVLLLLGLPAYLNLRPNFRLQLFSL